MLGKWYNIVVKRPVTNDEIRAFLKMVEECVGELYLRRDRLRNLATQLQGGYSDDLYLSFKAEFVVIVVMIRSLCLGCVDFKGPKFAERALLFDFEEDEGYSLRNALVLMNGRYNWQDMVDFLNMVIGPGVSLLRALKDFANSFVCHYDPKRKSFDELYRKITWSNGFYSRIEGVILKISGVHSAAKYHYENPPPSDAQSL